MNMFKFYPLCLLVFLSITLLSCSKDKGNTPSNLIDDPMGLKFDLVWSTGGTVMDAKTYADLDLFLMKGTTTVVKSDMMYSFEKMECSTSLADGDYIVNIDYFEGNKNVTYDLIISGAASTSTYKISGQFAASATGSVNVNLLKISKVGSKYIFTKL